MKFLVDAQLPPALKWWLIERGHDCIHALDLPRKDVSSDAEIADCAVSEGRTLISKDSDFVKMKLVGNKPEKLLVVTAGNIRNAELLDSFERNLETAIRLFTTFEIVELGNRFVTGRKRSQ